MDSREKFLSLLDYFSAENLLTELVIGLSSQECEDMYNHICNMHGIDQIEDEEL